MKNVERYYDQLSEIYDTATSGKLSWVAPQKAFDMIKPYIQPGDRVLDLGFGTGQSLERFVNLACDVYGVDISEKMLTKAKAKFPSAKLFKKDLDLTLDIFSPASFDISVSIGVLEFVSDLSFTLGEAKRLLRKGGHLCFTIELFLENHRLQKQRQSPSGLALKGPDDPANFLHHRFTHSEMLNLLQSLGLRLVNHAVDRGYFKTEALIPIQYGYYLVQN